MTVKRNDPCKCGSGLKYKNCHELIDTATPERRLDAAHRVYTNQWSHNAEALDQQGIYVWLSRLLVPFSPRRFMDIGTGCGQGILSLDTTFPDASQIVSLEENMACIGKAEEALGQAKVAYTRVRRLVHALQRSGHVLMFQVGRLEMKDGINIVESDPLCDEELWQSLSVGPKFDAMTVWFVGSHHLRHQCENLRPLGMKSPADYRLRVQNRAYELADVVLKKGGILHVADRGQSLDTDEARDALKRAHQEQASGTTLEVGDIRCHPYQEARHARRMAMVARKGHEVVDMAALNMAVLSVISTKK